MRRLPALLLALPLAAAAALLFAESERVARPVGGPPPARAWRSVCAGKPLPHIGELSAAIVERPLADEAVVRVDWRCGSLGEAHRLALVLPQGATLVEGEAEQILPEGLGAGVSTFRVRFLTGCSSDLTLRLCAVVGQDACSREAYVRLWECEERR